MSVDGYGVGDNQTKENPVGVAGEDGTTVFRIG